MGGCGDGGIWTSLPQSRGIFRTHPRNLAKFSAETVVPVMSNKDDGDGDENSKFIV